MTFTVSILECWRIASVPITGSLGLVAALTEGRNRSTHKLTVWGKISISVLTISIICGTWAQVQQVVQEKYAQERREKQARRLLHPIGTSPIFNIEFEGNCKSPALQKLCQVTPSLFPVSIPSIPDVDRIIDASLRATVLVDDAGSPELGDHLAVYNIDAPDSEVDRLDKLSIGLSQSISFSIFQDNGKVFIGIRAHGFAVDNVDGSFISLWDISGKRVDVIAYDSYFKDMKLKYLGITAEDGSVVSSDSIPISGDSYIGGNAYRYKYTFPIELHLH